ncbi:MAG: HIT domain-containing protein [Candidatus Omnitrophica bacterium]|nr:HIT domain-containing protein [Candidatus Omnitrophota bacterium]
MKDKTPLLWAPWRSKYIYSRKKKRCIFCNPKEYVLEKTKDSFSMLNIYPYNNGHVMVAPLRHVKSLEYLKPRELKDLMDLVVKTKKVLDKKLKPHGYNIGLNVGKVAGAGFAGHVHIHVVPRWTGDTNFMPAACGSKVISESLDVMYKIYRSK